MHKGVLHIHPDSASPHIQKSPAARRSPPKLICRHLRFWLSYNTNLDKNNYFYFINAHLPEIRLRKCNFFIRGHRRWFLPPGVSERSFPRTILLVLCAEVAGSGGRGNGVWRALHKSVPTQTPCRTAVILWLRRSIFTMPISPRACHSLGDRRRSPSNDTDLLQKKPKMSEVPIKRYGLPTPKRQPCLETLA